MKKLIPFVLMLLIAINLLSSQSVTNLTPKERQKIFVESIKSAEYIFEGEKIRAEIFYSEITKSYMISSIFKVARVLKGNVNSDTIEIVNYHYGDCPQKENRFIFEMNEKDYGFYYGKQLDYAVEQSTYIADNNIRLRDLPYSYNGFVKYDFFQDEVYQIHTPGIGIVFNTLNDFYNFLNKKADLKITPIPPVKSEPLNTPPPVDSAVIKHNKERWDAYQKLLEHKKQFVK